MVIVRGATLAGLAAAARLARLGHRVTIETTAPSLGATIAVPDAIAVPASWRDLFKKSGGHLQTELNRAGLELVGAPPRACLLPDGSTFQLPAERGEQYRAIASRFGDGEATSWRDLVDDLDGLWHAYRRYALEGVTPVRTTDDRTALWLDVTVADLADRAGAQLAPIVLAEGGSPTAPAIEAVGLSAERRFGLWQLIDAEGEPQPGSRLVDLLVERLVERGVAVAAPSEGVADLDASVPSDQPLRTRTVAEWLARVPIMGPDGALRASAASKAGPQPWAELGSAALAVYELHARLTGEDCRPTNLDFRLPRL